MSTERARKWYEKRKRALKRMYWKKPVSSPYWASGFKTYPWEIYDLFASLITRDGKVIDLGCGNGLLLKHLILYSGHKLEPYGVDFIEESIHQARVQVLPEYSENFTVANIVDYILEPKSFDFILVDPSDIHKDDLDDFINRIINACRSGGRVIFYTYRDVLKVLKILSIISMIVPFLKHRLPWKFKGIIREVGDLLPEWLRNNIEKRENKHVSIGIYNCK